MFGDAAPRRTPAAGVHRRRLLHRRRALDAADGKLNRETVALLYFAIDVIATACWVIGQLISYFRSPVCSRIKNSGGGFVAAAPMFSRRVR